MSLYDRGRMKQEDRLNIQAWLDGEVAPQKAAQIGDQVETNTTAKAVAEELKAVESVFKIGESLFIWMKHATSIGGKLSAK